MGFEWRLAVRLWDWRKLNFSSADLLIVGGNHSRIWVWSQLLFFFLFAVEIGGFYVCMSLETYNGPLKAGLGNWM